MTETTNTTVDTTAADAALGAAKRREVSPAATAALAAYRARAELGLAVLDVLEAGDPAVLAKYVKQAEILVKEQTEQKAKEAAERKANAGQGLEGYRQKTKDAMALAEYLKSTGVNLEEMLAKAQAAQAEQAK